MSMSIIQVAAARQPLQYAAAAWDPSSKKDISDIEQLQNQAVRFIAGIKERNGVEDAKTRLGLTPLHKRRRPGVETFDAHSC